MNLQRFHDRMRTLPCVVCVLHTGERTPAQALHHAGDAPDRDEWNVVPICHAHHQGKWGIHGLSRRGFEAMYKTTEMRLLAIARKLYAEAFE